MSTLWQPEINCDPASHVPALVEDAVTCVFGLLEKFGTKESLDITTLEILESPLADEMYQKRPSSHGSRLIRGVVVQPWLTRALLGLTGSAEIGLTSPIIGAILPQETIDKLVIEYELGCIGSTASHG